jgi:HK97 family phage portal protein
MTYSAVFACVRVLAETKASLPLKLYKKGPKGEKKEANDISLHMVLTYKANEEMTPFNWKEASMTSLCLGGNSFSQKLVNISGDIVGIYPLDYTKVKMDRNSDNRLIYKIHSKDKEYTRDTIFHVPGLSFDGISGLTPIGYAAKAIELGLIYENFGVNFFNNSAIPSGVIYTEGPLGDAAFARFKKDFKKNYAGMINKGVPMILEAGMKYNALNINQSDAQFLESKKFQLEDIARIYRVPLHLIQNLDRATNNNIEHQSLEFVMYTMLPWCKRDEENINMQLLTPEQQKAGYYVEYKMDSLLRGDAASRATAYATARQWGWMSVNDIRRLENMNPIDNGDIYLQPMNMVKAGSQIEDSIKAMTEEIYKMIQNKAV